MPIPVNPTTWSQRHGYDQGQLRPFPAALLTIAGQGSTDARGELLHADDPAAQLALALSNLLAVVAGAGLQVRDLAQLRVHVTDLESVLPVYDTVVERLALDDARPPVTLVEVRRLPLPGMAVLIDAIAVGAPNRTDPLEPNRGEPL